MKGFARHFFTGTSGLLLPVPNKTFYPEGFKDKSRLQYYASLVNTIEINSTFYKIPKSTTVQNWATDVPADFKFSFKLFKEITHVKNLAFNAELVAQFFQVISHVQDKAGCLLVQLPPSIRSMHVPEIGFLMGKLRECDLQNRWNIVFEFRHSSLYTDQIYELLEKNKLGLVIHDKIHGNSPMVDTNTNFVYIRLHGPNGNYRDSYSDDVLTDYADIIIESIADGKEVFVYFNNTMGSAHANLATLKSFVRNKI